MKKTKIIWIRVMIYLVIVGLMMLGFQDLFNADTTIGGVFWILLLTYVTWTVRNSFMKDDAFEKIPKMEMK